ncbi:growth inhibitor PemK [Rodentibacter rarus]|uniref:Growth inhibitor PemK n=1 Tax=Rodentibacter rarus TaxID=1908260 RepID=A0A1V3IIS5_9PAST|nr:type II toxin-antitoxin system PemK/MazF family toxin [Rodentibacter rarus]OOF41010.1 growth inhibitor PemK [Rodentibacter rarus]
MIKPQFKRGDIIRITLNPTLGRELQGESRPALVLSGENFHALGFMLIAPITQGNAELARDNGFAVSLSGTGCKTQGVIVAYQARIIDFTKRNPKKIEEAPDYIVSETQDIVNAILND